MNVRRKWMVVLALAASPLLSHAGPNKDNDKDDRPGHSQDFGNHDSDRGLNGHHRPPNDDHGRNGDNDCHHRNHDGDGWIDTHLGDHNKIDPVPDSGSSAILLGATLFGLLALSCTFQPKLATAKIRSTTRSQ